MKSTFRPVLNSLRRGYAAQAATKAKSAAEEGVQISRLANGALVATLDNNAAVSRVAVIYNAGARFEDRSNEGVTHAIRRCSDKSTKLTTGFGILMNMQQMGANVKCQTTRENMMYIYEGRRGTLDSGLHYLAHMAAMPDYALWEVKDDIRVVHLDRTILNDNPAMLCMEGLHSAAFRDGLGRSLVMPQHAIGSHSPAVINAFIAKHYQPGNMVIVGNGVGDHDSFIYKLMHQAGFAEAFAEDNYKGGAVTPTPSAYHGGDARLATTSKTVHTAVAAKGASLVSKDYIPLALLQNVMGAGRHIKYADGLNSKVQLAADKAASHPCVASTININYSDTGLFGVNIVSHAEDAGKVTKAVVGAFSSAINAGFTEAEVAKAKAQLKTAVLFDMENGGAVLEDMGVQALLTGQVLSTGSIMAAIDNTTADAIKQAGQVALSGKLTVSSVGDLNNAAYADEL